MNIAFKKAVKYAAKGRVALIGPAGAGKSYSALVMARTLVGPEGKIAALDTEHGSLSKYADLFDFDVIELDSFTAENFMLALRAAEAAGYGAFVADSLSHFWMGRDGALEFVDAAKKRSSSRDDMSGWKEFRPHERQMVDAMIASPMHIICTMRTKTAYEEQVNERTGKKQRIKIGLAPVQREGLEYEFDLVGLMDDENNFIVDKSRCPQLTGKVLTKPSEKEFAAFRDWLSGASEPAQSAPAPHLVPKPAAIAPTAAPAPAPRASASASTLNGNLLFCTVTEIVEKATAGGKPYFSLTIQEPVNGKRFLTCWHASLFDALRFTKGERCQFEISVSEKYLNVENVLAVGTQEYRDGKPYNADADEPVMAGASITSKLEITDDDIPF